jgi:hypothetical protein
MLIGLPADAQMGDTLTDSNTDHLVLTRADHSGRQ